MPTTYTPRQYEACQHRVKYYHITDIGSESLSMGLLLLGLSNANNFANNFTQFRQKHY